MFWRLGGQFVVVGGWLVQAQGTPQNSINTFSYYRTTLDSIRTPQKIFNYGQPRT